MSDPRSSGGRTWHERIAAFWRDVDDQRPEEMRRRLDLLLADLPADDPDVLFERASLHDFLGEEDDAIPLYRAALAAGLTAPHRSQAVIQLASSLRNVGDASGAIAAVREIADDDEFAPAARAFLALALYDDGKPAAALRTALATLAPFLPAYSRSISSYADELATRPRVRSIVVGVLVVDGYVLAEEYRSHDGSHFLRAPGGGIEFGESAVAALHREFREELDVALDEARLLGVTENIFDGHGKRGHEIVHVFAVRSADLEALPRDSRMPVIDGDTTVGWFPLEAVAAGAPPFYPPGILDLPRSPGARPGAEAGAPDRL